MLKLFFIQRINQYRQRFSVSKIILYPGPGRYDISKIKKAVTPADFDGQLKVLALSTFFYALLMLMKIMHGN